MLAGRVLKLVQSPVYSGAMQTESLHAALVRLGLRTVRDIVMEIAMNLTVFKSNDYAETMELLGRHSTATAHIARVVSKYTATEGEYAFLVGLLHDVGIAATLLALSHNAASQRPPDRAPDLIAIWPAVDRVHEQAAELMAEHWSLPPDLRMAVGAHHQVLIQGHPHPLSATVAIANELAHELGYGVVPKEDASAEDDLERDCMSSHTGVDHSTPKTLEHAREALQLNDAQVDLIRAEAAEVLSRLGEGGE